MSGPLVALMPSAGFDAGIWGMSKASGLGAAGSAVVVAVGASAGVDAASAAGALVAGVCAEAAVWGTGAAAPAGSGAV